MYFVWTKEYLERNPVAIEAHTCRTSVYFSGDTLIRSLHHTFSAKLRTFMPSLSKLETALMYRKNNHTQKTTSRKTFRQRQFCVKVRRRSFRERHCMMHKWAGICTDITDIHKIICIKRQKSARIGKMRRIPYRFRWLTLEALRGGGFFWLLILAPWPIVKSFGTTVPCLWTHLLTLIKWRHRWWRHRKKSRNLCVDCEISIFR